MVLSGLRYYFAPAKHGPFAEVYPELSDFNGLILSEIKGLGINCEEAEKKSQVCFERSPWCRFALRLWPAQRLYIRRGSFQMGQVCGIGNKPLEMGASCQNDNDLVFILIQGLTIKRETFENRDLATLWYNGKS